MARPAGSQGIRWVGGTMRKLDAKMTLFTVAFQRGLESELTDITEEVEAYAKDNAPWEDRTGNARAGLTAEVRHRLAYYYLDLFHTEPYGIWLEVRWDGRFAIIIPTLEHFGPIVMDRLGMGEILEDGY